MKENLKNLHEYVCAASDHWSSDKKLITLSVLLQNMAFKGEIILSALNTIRLMNKLCHNHVIDDVLSDLEMLQIAKEFEEDN